MTWRDAQCAVCESYSVSGCEHKDCPYKPRIPWDMLDEGPIKDSSETHDVPAGDEDAKR